MDLLSKQGYARPGTNQTVSFVSDDGNTLYRFMGDGSVWTSDAERSQISIVAPPSS